MAANRIYLVFSIVLSIGATGLKAQTFRVVNDSSEIKVEGTSNIHNWEIEVQNIDGKLVLKENRNKSMDIEALQIKIPTESLKSGRKKMDKNTYKALKTDQYGTINYELEKVNDIDCASSSHCVLSTSGTLTIIGNKKPVDLSFDVILSGNKAVFIGTYSLKMSEYNIDPPTALFGTITTGDELHIRFKTIFSK